MSERERDLGTGLQDSLKPPKILVEKQRERKKTRKRVPQKENDKERERACTRAGEQASEQETSVWASKAVSNPPRVWCKGTLSAG